MKAGTTSLHEWLSSVPELWPWPGKEAHFFSQDRVWDRGLSWYSDLFADARPDQLVGESSTSYTDPEYIERAVDRIRRTVPEARFVYVVRHPVARLRSDYRHQVREGRQTRPLLQAVLQPDSGHVGRSLYARCLTPYLDAFGADRTIVVKFEDLVSPPHQPFDDVLRHLGVPPRPAPGTSHNALEDLTFSPNVKRWLRQTGLMSVAERLPAPARRMAARLVRRDPGRDPLLASANADLPDSVLDRLWADAADLQTIVGAPAPLWEPGSPG